MESSRNGSPILSTCNSVCPYHKTCELTKSHQNFLKFVSSTEKYKTDRQTGQTDIKSRSRSMQKLTPNRETQPSPFEY